MRERLAHLLSLSARGRKEILEITNCRDVAGQGMTKPDQEGLLVKIIINRDVAGPVSSECPSGKVHLLRPHPNAEPAYPQVLWVVRRCLIDP